MARATANLPVTFTSIWRRKLTVDVNSKGPSTMIPAEFTNQPIDYRLADSGAGSSDQAGGICRLGFHQANSRGRVMTSLALWDTSASTESFQSAVSAVINSGRILRSSTSFNAAGITSRAWTRPV